MSATPLPDRAQVIIVGGGVIGCSVAYHLAKAGVGDILLLERKQLTSGTTWHAAGLVTTLRATEAQTWLARYTLDLYGSLEQETGQATGFIECGSVQLAITDDWLEEMRRGVTMARMFGGEVNEVSPSEVRDLFPLAYVDDLKCGFHFPRDGRVNPADVTMSLAKGARMRGAKLVEGVPVTDVLMERGRAIGVATPDGDIMADTVVLCPGMWGRALGKRVGIDLPLQAAEHYYMISEPVEGVSSSWPILRDPGRSAYIREEVGKIMVGLFEPTAAPWGVDGIPDTFCFDELPADWERMEETLAHAMERLPILMETGIRTLFCGPESFTPDHNYLMGKAPFVDNVFVACGFNSLGVLSAGGAGHVMAHWITEGYPPLDVLDVDVRRFQPCENNKAFVVDRTVESLGIAYQQHWPNRQWETARGMRQSVLHERLAARGACFGQAAGWERPNWFAFEGQQPVYDYSFGKQNWFANNAHEHMGVRTAVGLFDQTSFAKVVVQGRDACAVLNRLSTADVDLPVGRLVYTHFLNARGGIEADITIARLAETRFLVVTPGWTTTRVLAWMHENTPADAFCVVTDMTGAWTLLNIQGPASRTLLQGLTGEDLGPEAFRFGDAREVEFGYQSALVLRVSYSGELGFEVYAPTEMALPLYDRIAAAGEGHGLVHCGYHTLNSLRIEKAFREWSHDIGPHDSLLEAGLGFTCAWDKPGGFIGREALLAQREAGAPKRRMLQFVLDDPEPVLTHMEPIVRNGVRIGYTTSAGYGHALGACVAMGYVDNPDGLSAGDLAAADFRIMQANRTYTARAFARPAYDPAAERFRN